MTREQEVEAHLSESVPGWVCKLVREKVVKHGISLTNSRGGGGGGGQNP